MHIQHTSFALGLPDLFVSYLAIATDGALMVWVEGRTGHALPKMLFPG
ncbi:MAG: hypothetical protein AB1331_01960 [Bacillota bacterium]